MLSFFNNPITLAVLAVATVGYIVYDLLNSNNERQQRQQYDYRRGGGPYNPPPPPPDPPYHRRPPPAPAIRSPDRRRKSKERSKTRSDSPDVPPSDPGSKKTDSANEISDSANENFKSPQFDNCNPNLNRPKSDEKKIFEKDVISETTDDCTRNPDVKVRHRKRSVRKNVTTEKSRKGSYLSKKLNVVSLNNIEPSHLHGNQRSEQSDESGKIISTSSTSDNSDMSSTESILSEREEMYKRNVCENIQNSFASSSQHCGYASSSQHGGYASSSTSTYEDLEVCESEICLACDENRVNTRADPCNHRYLCFSCAKKVIRMTKRCRVCRRRIEKFHCI